MIARLAIVLLLMGTSAGFTEDSVSSLLEQQGRALAD